MTAQQLVSVDALAHRLNDQHTKIIDCRHDLTDPEKGRRDYAIAHIPGAVFADLDTDLASPVTAESGRHPLPDVAELAHFFGTCGIDEHSNVVVYDSGNGAMAARCWWLLRWLGHSKVQLLDGGYAAWCKSDNELQAGSTVVEAKPFRGEADWSLVIETTELVAALPDISRLNLFDARESARFLGEVEPLDSVAGHIPGANNQPLSGSVDGDGRWKSQEALEAIWRQALGPEKDLQWAVMCGSGVTACHIALSAVQAGYRAPRLYAGSWSEWIRQDSRPIATGSPQKAKRALADMS